MLKKSYNILNNGKNTLIAINVINKKIKDKVSFSRDDNDLILKINGKSEYCYLNLPYSVWHDINNNSCFIVEFGPLGAIAEYDVILD